MADELTLPDEQQLAEQQTAEQQVAPKEDFGEKAVKVAASAVLATTLVGALSEPPRAELITLPEPVPIVQVINDVEDDGIADEDEEDDEKQSRWMKLLKVLRYLIIALMLAATLAFGLLKGCAGIGVGLLPPAQEEQQEQQAHTTSTEDERGVAQSV